MSRQYEVAVTNRDIVSDNAAGCRSTPLLVRDEPFIRERLSVEIVDEGLTAIGGDALEGLANLDLGYVASMAFRDQPSRG